MRHILSTVAAAFTLVCTGCGAAGPAAIEPDTAFSLRLGEQAQTRDGQVRIGFDAVLADSRCPKGEQCIQAGAARIRVWLQQGGGARQSQELQLPAAPSAAAPRLGERELRLLALQPYPRAGQPTTPSGAIATLELSRARAAPAK